MSGVASPCLFFHPDRNISIVVHGDDFNALAVKAELDWYEIELAKHFEIKIRGRMGPGGTCEQIKIFNRILALTADGLEYEADPRHVDLLASSMALSASHSVTTPGVKEPEADDSATKQDESNENQLLNPDGDNRKLMPKQQPGDESAQTQNGNGGAVLGMEDKEKEKDVLCYLSPLNENP